MKLSVPEDRISVGSARRVFLIAALLFLVGFCREPGLAQPSQTKTTLAGLRTILLQVEKVDDNTCGLTQSDVETSVRFVLSQSKIHVAGTSVTWLDVHVNVRDDCGVAIVRLELDTLVKISETNRQAYAAIWSSSAWLSGQVSMKDRIISQVETYTKRFVVDWASANH